MSDPYSGRLQTKAKHFILRRYLQALAFKVFTFSDITYVDGFSGPWETKTEDFADSSFMIAMSVLRDAQEHFERSGKKRRVRCFFAESDANSFAQLRAAVAPFHKPDEGFEIHCYHGKFEDAVAQIRSLIGTSFPLIFIDPTGWTGYPFDKIKPLFAFTRCEVLINFMYEFVNRFSHSDEPDIISSLDPILGGPGWVDRLDPTLARGAAVEQLFRETLKSVGGFSFVVSTKVDRETVERPHFFIAYATKNLKGLTVFRETEYAALRAHAKNRANAKESKRQAETGTVDLFAGYQAEVVEESIDDIVADQMKQASAALLKLLSNSGALPFADVVAALLQAYMLRETNVKAICVDLAKSDKIENTWGARNRKPNGTDTIKLVTAQ